MRKDGPAGTVTRRAVLAAASLPLLGCARPAPIEGGFTGAASDRGHLLRAPRSASVPSITRRTRVVIAGGGVAGLACARALRLQGTDDFALLELENKAGGNSRAGMVSGIACPLGAHYLPVPGDTLPEVQDLLEELGLRKRVAGRWTYDDRHLCHSPQERLFFQGNWQEGLLPMQGVGAGTLAQYRRFSALVLQARASGSYAIPVSKTPVARFPSALAAITFIAWLEQNQLTDGHLRWYLDYCCRDDYGAGIGTVSAWAGLHYFASRHGFHVPGDTESESEAVLTWPEGNGWLTDRLAQTLGERLRTGRVVTRIASSRHGVEVDAFDITTQITERWQAQHAIVALPIFIAARVVEAPPAFLQRAVLGVRYAPWLVVNLHLREPLADRAGAAPSWDNVLYGAAGLGYVDAAHQRLDPTPGPTVLSWYCAPGESARQSLLDQPWTLWRDRAIRELSAAHSDIAAKTTRVEIARYGHAMAIPVPAPSPTAFAIGAPTSLRAGRLRFAHSDWAGYSIFEEAFTLGHLQAQGLA